MRVTRMLLHYKYPRYLEDGALAFSNSLPTIYSSVTSPLGAVQHLCRQLGLPLACVRPVPVNTHFGKLFTLSLHCLTSNMCLLLDNGFMSNECFA